MIKLNLVYLKRIAFGLSDGMKIHIAAGEKHDRDIKTFRRIRRVDVRLERLQITVTPFLENELQLAGIFPRSDPESVRGRFHT